MRIEGTVENVPVLVAIGATEDGMKLVLGMQSGVLKRIRIFIDSNETLKVEISG